MPVQGIPKRKTSNKVKSTGSFGGKFQLRILLPPPHDDMLCRCWENLSISLQRKTAAAEVPQERFTLKPAKAHTQSDTCTHVWERARSAADTNSDTSAIFFFFLTLNQTLLLLSRVCTIGKLFLFFLTPQEKSLSSTFLTLRLVHIQP